MKSITKIKKQANNKRNSKLVGTILTATKNKSWIKIAKKLSQPREKTIQINLEEVDKKSKEGETILILGKVLSMGNLQKKIKIIAVNFSERAKEKIKEAESEFSFILNEIKQNPEAKGIKILE